MMNGWMITWYATSSEAFFVALKMMSYYDIFIIILIWHANFLKLEVGFIELAICYS
jgi:hypothetical protein